MPKVWYNDPWVWGLGGVAGLVALFPGVVSSVGTVVTEGIDDVMNRGNKLTRATWYKGDEGYGFIQQSPDDLVIAASMALGRPIDKTVYTLARMIRSEGAAQGALRVHVLMNDLKRFKYANNAHDLATFSNDKSRRGKYGKQWSGAYLEFPVANARRYATSKDPYESDVKTVERALAEWHNGTDRAQGASKFLDKSALAFQTGARDFDTINREWTGDGYTAFTLPQYGDDLVLYRRA